MSEEKYNKRFEMEIEKINNQRQLASTVLCGFLYDDMKLTASEQKFVRKCNRTTKPIGNVELSILQKLVDRRFGK